MQWARIMTLSAGALTVLTGCRDILGLDRREATEGGSGGIASSTTGATSTLTGADDGEGGASPALDLVPACADCVAARCADAASACAAEAPCRSLAECIAEAGVDHPLERAACRTAFPEATSSTTFAELESCLRAPCQDPCVGRKGFVAAYSEQCQDCMATECIDAMAACAGDARCELTVVQAIGDPDRITPPTMLRFTSSGSDTPENALAGCLSACNTPCARNGGDLRCMGAYEWPEPRTAQATLEFAVRRYRTFEELEDVEGARVDACGIASETCEPLTSGVTDAEASVLLDLPLSPSIGFRGFLRSRQRSDAPEDAFVTTHTFPGFPIWEDVRLGQFVYSPDAAALLFATFQFEPIPGRGSLGLQFLDCANVATEKVEVRMSDGVLAASGVAVAYLGFGDTTDSSGIALVGNIEPGCQDVAGYVDGEEVFRTRLFVAPDVVTALFARPRSSPSFLGSACIPEYPLP